MPREIRIEINSRDAFWRNAFKVEWDFQYPQRKLSEETPGFFCIPESWLPDVERVGKQCFSNVKLAPSDPGRRNIFRLILSRQK
ncbi:MAG: hypothetical protein ABI882_00050 [Acidobacteriota bacterium]